MVSKVWQFFKKFVAKLFEFTLEKESLQILKKNFHHFATRTVYPPILRNVQQVLLWIASFIF